MSIMPHIDMSKGFRAQCDNGGIQQDEKTIVLFPREMTLAQAATLIQGITTTGHERIEPFHDHKKGLYVTVSGPVTPALRAYVEENQGVFKNATPSMLGMIQRDRQTQVSHNIITAPLENYDPICGTVAYDIDRRKGKPARPSPVIDSRADAEQGLVFLLINMSPTKAQREAIAKLGGTVTPTTPLGWKLSFAMTEPQAETTVTALER